MYIEPKLFVAKDASATALNILASENLFRAGMAAEPHRTSGGLCLQTLPVAPAGWEDWTLFEPPR